MMVNFSDETQIGYNWYWEEWHNGITASWSKTYKMPILEFSASYISCIDCVTVFFVCKDLHFNDILLHKCVYGL